MVFIGFGIVAASLSFLIYRHGFASLSRLLALWKGSHDTRQEGLGSPRTLTQRSEGSDGVKAENEVLIVEEHAECEDVSKSHQSDFQLEVPSIRNKTPLPSFTLDGAGSSDEKYTSGSGEPSKNNHDLASKMASESTLQPERSEKEPSVLMPPPPPPSRPFRRLPQASASALIPPPSQPSFYSSTLRHLPRPTTAPQPPSSAVTSQTSRRPLEASASELMPPPSRPSPNTSTLRPFPTPSTSPQTPPSAVASQSSGRSPEPASKLMPPASRSSLRPLSKASTTLQPPPSAASSLRVPPSRSPNPLSPSSFASSASTSTLAPSKRPSRKVLLDPGHSPLDWAYLTQHPPTSTYFRGESVPRNLFRIPPSRLRQQNGRKGKDAWGVWQGKVYNLTPYMKFHPGGVDELMKAAGREKDGERLFIETHPWVNWESMLSECLLGILVDEGEHDTLEGGAKVGSSLEAMD